MNNRKIRRGDIFLYDFGENTGSIQNGYRPVLAVQADDFNANAPTVIVAAITSATGKRYLPSHILIGEGFGLTKPSMVMLEQQLTVNKDKLTNFIGHIYSNNISRKIHNGLMKVYGYWDYKRYNTANIRCLCRDCLQIYKALPEFSVTRVNPLSKVKEKCDKCQGFGYDYFVYERNPRPKGGKGNG